MEEKLSQILAEELALSIDRKIIKSIRDSTRKSTIKEILDNIRKTKSSE